MHWGSSSERRRSERSPDGCIGAQAVSDEGANVAPMKKEDPAATISLGAQAGLPAAPPRRGSPAPCGLPGSSGGPPSNAACLALLRVGLAEPARSPAPLVRSYRTVSPLPLPKKIEREAVC